MFFGWRLLPTFFVNSCNIWRWHFAKIRTIKNRTQYEYWWSCCRSIMFSKCVPLFAWAAHAEFLMDSSWCKKIKFCEFYSKRLFYVYLKPISCEVGVKQVCFIPIWLSYYDIIEKNRCILSYNRNRYISLPITYFLWNLQLTI